MPALDIDTSTLTDLDFDLEQPCEHSQHRLVHDIDQPASWAQSGICPACLVTIDLLVCEQGRLRMNRSRSIHCVDCDHRAPREDWLLHFELLPGAVL